jgi:aldose 1-epimerase
VEKKMSIKKQVFGKTEDGKNVDLYTLTNSTGLNAKIMTYGGIVTSLQVPDRNGNFADIVLGCDSLDEYIKGSPYFGALIGRFGNRIAKGKFTLDGVEYTLATNNGPNHLHGGIKGFDKVVWNAKQMQTDQGPALKLTYRSRDGEEGYPGNLSCTVIYTLTNNNELKISYEAKTDKATVINLTHHSYFNLGGHNSGDILGHTLIINADRFTPVDKDLIPTGEIKPVKGTPMDFTKPMAIGSRIKQGGYDHNYVLNSSDGSLALAASVYEPKSGRVMEIFTTEPGIQFYTGNFLDGSVKGKGAVYNKHNGFCLETQHFPDSPNKPNFPSVVLKPGEKYTQLTVYKFSAR